MALTTYTADTAVIAALADEPNETDGLTAAQFKAKFDEAITAWKGWFNVTHIPQLDAAQLPYIYGSADTIKTAMEALTAGVMPDGSVTAAKLAAAVSGNISDIETLARKNLVNILRLKLQQTLAATDIDAWSDLIADGSLINQSNSTNIMLSSGKIGAISLAQYSGSFNQGLGSSSTAKVGQTFTPFSNVTLQSVKVSLRKSSSPTDNITVGIYSTSSGLPNTLLASTTTTLSGSTITSSFVEYTFNFADLALTGGTEYAIVVGRSGAVSGTNYYLIQYNDAGGYADGSMCLYDSSWALSSGYDLNFDIGISAGTIAAIWDAVTATEALTYAAVTAEQTVGTGTITWYLSDDGTNWTEITSLDAIQTVSFDAASLYLKCVLTGDATVSAVAWGGY